MTLDVMERPAPTLTRLIPRSLIATADVDLARRTLSELTQPAQGFEDAGSRMLAKLRSFVVKDEA